MTGTAASYCCTNMSRTMGRHARLPSSRLAHATSVVARLNVCFTGNKTYDTKSSALLHDEQTRFLPNNVRLLAGLIASLLYPALRGIMSCKTFLGHKAVLQQSRDA